jgi:ferredoxin
MKLEISVDREMCVGSGNCMFWAPGAFDLDDDGVSFVVDSGAATPERLKAAADMCPTRAIAVKVKEHNDE